MSTKICVIARDEDLFEKMLRVCLENLHPANPKLSFTCVDTLTATMADGIMILNKITKDDRELNYTMTLKSLIDDVSVTVTISEDMYSRNYNYIANNTSGMICNHFNDKYFKFEHAPLVEFLDAPIIRIVLPDDLDPINDSIEICSILRKYGDYIPNNENDSDEADRTLIPVFYKPVIDKLESIVSKLLLGYGHFTDRVDYLTLDSKKTNYLLTLPIGERAKYIVDKEINNCNLFYPLIEKMHEYILTLIPDGDDSLITISDDLDIALSRMMGILTGWCKESYILKSKNIKDLLKNKDNIPLPLYSIIEAFTYKRILLTRKQLAGILDGVSDNVRSIWDIESLSDYETIKNLIS